MPKRPLKPSVNPLHNWLFGKMRAVAAAVIVYVLLVAVDAIIAWLSPVAGALFSISLIFGNIAYLEKVSYTTKRTIHEFLPTLVTWGMALLLHQWQDYAWGMLSLVVLFYRAVDLYSRAPTKKRYRSQGAYRIAGSAAHNGRSSVSL